MKKDMKARAAALGLAALIASAPPLCVGADDDDNDLPIKPFTAEYDARQDGDMQARITERLHRGDGDEPRWRYVRETAPTGWLARSLGLGVTEQTAFQWAGHVRPLTYDYERTGPKEKRVALRFDWQNGKVINEMDGAAWGVDLKTGAQDKMSVGIALQARMLKSAVSTDFTVADGGRLKVYDFKIIGRETVDTAFGKLQTIKISRNRRGRDGGETLIWAAPALDHLAVKLQKKDDGEVVEITLRSLQTK